MRGITRKQIESNGSFCSSKRHAQPVGIVMSTHKRGGKHQETDRPSSPLRGAHKDNHFMIDTFVSAAKLEGDGQESDRRIKKARTGKKEGKVTNRQ